MYKQINLKTTFIRPFQRLSNVTFDEHVNVLEIFKFHRVEVYYIIVIYICFIYINVLFH